MGVPARLEGVWPGYGLFQGLAVIGRALPGHGVR